MKYRDLAPTSGDRFRVPPSHPVLATLTIDPVNWIDLQRFDDDNPATVILGRDDPHNGRMTVYIACASGAVRKRLQDGWD